MEQMELGSQQINLEDFLNVEDDDRDTNSTSAPRYFKEYNYIQICVFDLITSVSCYLKADEA